MRLFWRKITISERLQNCDKPKQDCLDMQNLISDIVSVQGGVIESSLHKQNPVYLLVALIDISLNHPQFFQKTHASNRDNDAHR